MISSLSKLAEKTFIIGFLTPVLAFILAAALTFGDVPAAQAVRAAIASEKTFEDLVLLSAGVWFAATLLQALNRPVYRALEGYWGPLKSERTRRRQLQQHRAEREALRVLYARSRQEGAAGEGATIELNLALERFRRRFPSDEADILPTRFGNINRAFERYPQRVYELESTAIWPRLVGVVPADYRSGLTEARSQVDGFVNLWLLSLAYAAAAIVHFVFHLGEGAWAAVGGFWSLSTVYDLPWIDGPAAAAGLAAAWGASRLADDRAVAFGEQVKAAFDLYLPALIVQLGYTLPSAPNDRKAFWADLANSYLSQAPAPDRWRIGVPAKAVEPNKPWWAGLIGKKKAAPESAASS